MKDVVFIKLYRPAYVCLEFHDLIADKLTSKVQALKQYGEQIGKEVFFSVCINESANSENNSCFAQITHSSDVNPFERQKYVDILKEFTKDAEIKNGNICEYNLPLRVILTKVVIESFDL